jgi:hypothetical protein
VRLNFVFFTGLVSELYGQRICVCVCVCVCICMYVCVCVCVYINKHALYGGVNLSYICGPGIDDKLFHSGKCCLVSWSYPQKHISSPTITFKWNSWSLSSLLKVLAFIYTTVILLFTQQVGHKLGSNPKHVQAVFQNALNQPK